MEGNEKAQYTSKESYMDRRENGVGTIFEATVAEKLPKDTNPLTEETQ